MGTRSDPNKQRFPALRGRIIIDTYRGQMRTRSWPRKTGTPKSATVRALNTWFTAANRLAKRVLPTQQALAIDQAKGTGLYPRDLLVKSIYGGMFDMATEDGRLIQHRLFQVEDRVFNGARLEIKSAIAIVGGVGKILSWPLPVLDTAGFWNVLAPTRLTIPNGVTVVEVVFCWTSTGSIGDNRSAATIIITPGAFWFEGQSADGVVAVGCSTGPMPVSAGDFFEFQAFSAISTGVRTEGSTFATLNVLGAG